MVDIFLKRTFLESVHTRLNIELDMIEKEGGRLPCTICLSFVGDTCLAEKAKSYGFGYDYMFSVLGETDSSLDKEQSFSITSEYFNILYDRMERDDLFGKPLLLARDTLWIRDSNDRIPSFGVPVKTLFTSENDVYSEYEEKRELIDVLHNGKKTILHVDETYKELTDDVRKTMKKMSRVEVKGDAMVVYVQDRKTASWTDSHISVVSTCRGNRMDNMFDGGCFHIPVTLMDMTDNGLTGDVEVLYADDGNVPIKSLLALYHIPETEWYACGEYQINGNLDRVAEFYRERVEDITNTGKKANTVCVPRSSCGRFKAILQDCKKTYAGCSDVIRPMKFELRNDHVSIIGGKGITVKESFQTDDIEGITNLACDGYLTDSFNLPYILDVMKHYSRNAFAMSFTGDIMMCRSLGDCEKYTKHVALASLLI